MADLLGVPGERPHVEAVEQRDEPGRPLRPVEVHRVDAGLGQVEGVAFQRRADRPPPVGMHELHPGLGPEPDQLVIRLHPTTGIRLLVDAQRGESYLPEPINLDMEFAQEGGEGPTPYEVLLHAALIGNSTRFTRQDNIEETWRICAPLLDKPPKVQPYKQGSWGPKAADRLVADYGGWHGPWVAR